MAVLAVLLAVKPMVAVGDSAPRFEDYSVAEHYKGPTAPVDLRSESQARRFRTVLREGAPKGPNFAGHLTIVSWGCGTNCQVFAIVDARNGRVRFPDFGSEVGQDFRVDSRLLVINPPSAVAEYLDQDGGCPPSPIDSWLTSRYFEWDGAAFRHIIDIPACPSSR
jgi:hypothetical protein